MPYSFLLPIFWREEEGKRREKKDREIQIYRRLILIAKKSKKEVRGGRSLSREKKRKG